MHFHQNKLIEILFYEKVIEHLFRIYEKRPRISVHQTNLPP